MTLSSVGKYCEIRRRIKTVPAIVTSVTVQMQLAFSAFIIIECRRDSNAIIFNEATRAHIVVVNNSNYRD